MSKTNLPKTTTEQWDTIAFKTKQNKREPPTSEVIHTFFKMNQQSKYETQAKNFRK